MAPRAAHCYGRVKMQETARKMLQMASSRGKTSLLETALSHIEHQAQLGALATRHEITGSYPPSEVYRLAQELEQRGFRVSRLRSDSMMIGWSKECLAYVAGREERERREHEDFKKDMKASVAIAVVVIAVMFVYDLAK